MILCWMMSSSLQLAFRKLEEFWNKLKEVAKNECDKRLPKMKKMKSSWEGEKGIFECVEIPKREDKAKKEVNKEF